MSNTSRISQPAGNSTAPNGSLPVRAAPNVTPGAYSVSPGQGGVQVFRVMVPNNIVPGQEFQVYAGQRIVRVVCPPNIQGGMPLQLTIPAEPVVTMSSGIPPMAPTNVNSEAPVDMPEHLRRDVERNISQTDSDSDNESEGYLVAIPPNVREGEQFHFTLNGNDLLITCPIGVGPGETVRIKPPPNETSNSAAESNLQESMGNALMPDTRSVGERVRRTPTPPPPQENMQMFEVVVPRGVRGGQPFALLAGQQRVLVTCPPHAGAGQKIRFRLPILLAKPPQELESVLLSYDKDGWARNIRVSDMKFQWMRFDKRGDISQHTRFSAETSAYVRKLDVRPGLDVRMRTGSISLLPASEAVVDSFVRGGPQGRELVSYGEIASAQVKNFSEKAEWLKSTCKKLSVEWDEGHMRLNIRRDYLLSDSMASVMSLSRKDMRKMWKFEFIDETGFDAGYSMREWFQLVTEELFNPDTGLWQQSSVNQMCMDINPASSLSHPDNHLVYFRFLGRVLGKALFEQQLISGHMMRHLYKHILGWPVTFEDLELVDQSIYKSLKDIMQDADNVEHLCLNFTVSENFLGAHNEIPLVEDGENIDVTASNLPEYIECRLKYQMLGRVKPQLTELLLGFFDVIDEPLLTVFDFQELELLMCGLPEINTIDWKENTEYTGDFTTLGGNHPVCKWFWEVVEEYDQEYRARLLQFATGTSGVPSGGFAILQGRDRNIKQFSLHGVAKGNEHFPNAHTCFNRIDLPVYLEKSTLKEKLTVALEMAATGFDIE